MDYENQMDSMNSYRSFYFDCCFFYLQIWLG